MNGILVGVLIKRVIENQVLSSWSRAPLTDREIENESYTISADRCLRNRSMCRNPWVSSRTHSIEIISISYVSDCSPRWSSSAQIFWISFSALILLFFSGCISKHFVLWFTFGYNSFEIVLIRPWKKTCMCIFRYIYYVINTSIVCTYMV